MQNDPPKAPETSDLPETPTTPPVSEPVDLSSELSSSGTTTTTPLDPSVTPPPAPLPPADSSNNPFPEKPKSKASLIIIIAVGILLLGVGGYFGYQYYMSTLDSAETNDSTAETTQPEETTPSELTATELDTFATNLKDALSAEDGLTVTTSEEDTTKDGVYPAFFKSVGYDYFTYPAESTAIFVTGDDIEAAKTTVGENLVALGLEKDDSESIYSSDSLLCNVLNAGPASATYISVTCSDKDSHLDVAKAAQPFYEAFKLSDSYSAQSSYVLSMPVITDETGAASDEGTMATMEVGIVGGGSTNVEFTKVDSGWTTKSTATETEA